MELSQSRYHSQQRWESPSREGANLPSLPHRQSPSQHLPGPASLLDNTPNDRPTIPRSERAGSETAPSQASPMQLPPIREIVDFSARVERSDAEYRMDRSPISIGKRRRPFDEEDDEDARSRYSPRQRSPRPLDRPQSGLAIEHRRPSGAYPTPTPDSWSTRSSPYQSTQGLAPLQPSTFPIRPMPDMRASQAPTLPPLSALANTMPLAEYALGGPRPCPSSYTYPPPSRYSFDVSNQHPSFSYGYQQPRVQSYSGPTYATQDRHSFVSAHSMYPGVNPYGPEGHEREGETRQRKRRGNLPKETTDKLRAWFMSHLTHPYPTEDEKQELMRQTGLQMNQISNWFINARRRQLPTMINNARAESDARTARGGEAHALAQSHDYDTDADRRTDAEGSPFEENLDPRIPGGVAGPRKRDSV